MRKETRLALSAIALALGAGAAQAGQAIKGDATKVAPLGGSGYFNPATESLPRQCRTMPNVVTTEACPSGTTGSIKKTAYYYCPTGAEPGLYSTPTVSEYGCVPVEAPPVAGGGATGAGQCEIATMTGTKTYQIKYENGYKAREVDFNRNTGAVLETPWTAVSVPSSGVRLGSGTLSFDPTLFRATAVVGVATTQTCQGSMPLPPPPTYSQCSISGHQIFYTAQMKREGTSYFARGGTIGAWMPIVVPGGRVWSGSLAISTTSTRFTAIYSPSESLPLSCSTELP